MSRLAFADFLLRDPAALVIVKATVVLALASAVAAAAKRVSAARRHTLWLVALVSCAWLVLSSPLVPSIVIRTPVPAQNAVTISDGPVTPTLARLRTATTANASRARERLPATEPVSRSPLRSTPMPSHPLVALWIIGCVALLVRHAIGFAGTARLRRRASMASDDETARELAGVTAAVGVRRDVRLAYSAEVQSPITFDVGKSYVVLPTDARSWPISRRRAVLVHEAAHIARGDWLSQAVGQLTCDLFWFHPLVWRAFGRLRDEAERAADDCVLRSGMPACEYATHLLELAHRTTSGRPELVAVGIVSSNDLERRFIAMLDTTRSRAGVTVRARALTTSVALALVCPLASLRVAAPARAPSAASPYVSTRQPAQTTPAAARTSDRVRVSRTTEAHPALVAQPVLETAQSSIAVIDHSSPSPVVHPDFSGRWKPDTAASPTIDDYVSDSTIITQSKTAISLESRGYYLDSPTHNRFQAIPFGGAQATGFTVTLGVATNFVASAVWLGDTLVFKTYAQAGYPTAGVQDLLTYERMTLSPDGQTLFITNSSFLNGKYRGDGPHTFVLRRITP